MMRKARRLGKGFITLSALLLMFSAVGCDDSDNTDRRKFNAEVVEGGKKTFISDYASNSPAPIEYSTIDPGAETDGQAVDTIVTVRVPANTSVFSDSQLDNELTGDIEIVVQAYDPNSFRFFPDDEESDWVTAGYARVFVRVNGDRVNEVYFENDIDIEIDLSDNDVGDMITAAGTPNLPVYRRGDQGWNRLGEFPLDPDETITITTNRLSWFLIGFPSGTDYLDYRDFANDVCDAIIEFEDDGNNIIDIDGSPFDDRINLGYVGNLTEGGEIIVLLSFGVGDFSFPLKFRIIDAECLTGI
jgi:hypothetical protein